MRKCVSITDLIFATLGLTAFASGPLNYAIAHEEHELECNETNINAMNADIQAMKDGEAKTTATTEMKMVEETMAKKDLKDCTIHMRNAMEGVEK